MKKFYVYLLAMALTATVFTGCGKKNEENIEISENAAEELEESDDDFDFDEYDSDYGAYADGAEWGNNYEGSAVYVDGTTAVVTIAVNAKDESWDEKGLKAEKEKIKTALDFISDSVKEYKKTAEFAFDEEDLNYEMAYEESTEDFEMEDYDTILDDFIEENVDAEKIREKYKADGIAYLVLLNGLGESFSEVHLQEDETDYFNEAAYIYKTGYNEDYEEVEIGPSVYAHHLLSLFGAVELMEPDPTYGYTANLCKAVNEKYSDDIMFTVFESNGSINTSKISQKLTDITAYTLGLIEDFDELSDNEVFRKEYRACFADNYMFNTNDGEDFSDYEWDDEYLDDEDWADEDLSDEDWADEDLDDEDWDDEDWDDEDLDDEGWDDEDFWDDDDAWDDVEEEE